MRSASCQRKNPISTCHFYVVYKGSSTRCRSATWPKSTGGSGDIRHLVISQRDLAPQRPVHFLYSCEGVPQNFIEAHKWFNLAATSGHEQARENRDLGTSKMVPAQVAEAQKLAREWRPK